MRFINEFPFWWPPIVGLDIETKGTDNPTFTDPIVTIQIGCPDGDVYIYTEQFELLNDLFEDRNILKICHQGKFEYSFLKWHLGVTLGPIWDTMLMERVLTSGKGLDTDLASTIQRRTGKFIEKDPKLQKSFFPGMELTEKRLWYIENDVKHLPNIYEEQKRLLSEERMDAIKQLEHNLLPIVAEMELVGINIENKAWNSVVSLLRAKVDKCIQIMCHELNLPSSTGVLFGDFAPPINFNSWQQVKAAFERNGIAVKNMRDETLEDYMQSYPGCAAVQAYRDYTTYDKLIGFGYLKYINPKTGRIHTSYKQLGARTGRFTSSNPNLQNVPRDSKIRATFIPAPGNVFIQADYGQQEMRVMAEMSGDKNLLDVCLSDDPHLSNARKLFKNPEMKELSGELRIRVKNTGFAMNYGAGLSTFAHSSGLTKEEAKPIFDALRATYPGVFVWGAITRKFLHKHGYVSTIMGRKRWFPGSKEEEGSYFNEAVNTPIQGSSADMIKLAMVRVANRLKEENLPAWLVLQVHDELVVESKKEAAKEVAQIVDEEMEMAGAEMLKKIPCPAKAKITECWTK